MPRRRAFPPVLAIALLLPACGALMPACRGRAEPGVRAPESPGREATTRQPAARDAATAAPVAGPAVVVDTGERRLTFHVELARTRHERERGLMYRERLAPDTGMLFAFESPAPLTFWMKNTLIPLDMIFIDERRRVVGIVANAEPRTESPRRVNGLSQYVLEISGGLAAKLGIRAGQTVEFREMPGLP